MGYNQERKSYLTWMIHLRNKVKRTHIDINRLIYLLALEIDQRIVVQLVDMGFDIEGCKKAVYNTNNQGQSDIFQMSSKFFCRC